MSSFLVTTLGIPVVLAAIAITQVDISSVADSFLGLDLHQQVAWLTLLFAVIFAAVATSHVVSSNNNNAGIAVAVAQAPPPPFDYPLEEMSKVQTDKDKFKILYPFLAKQILDHMKQTMPQAAIDWCRKMMDYNVPHGKLNRGVTVITVLRALQKNKPLSEFQIAKASVAGWAIEFLQAFFLVADDLMDDSKTRRGQPCWFRQVKLIAINDAFLLESFCLNILKWHFGNGDLYQNLVQLLLNVIQKTEFGQLLDLTSQQPSSSIVDLDEFTMQRYSLIVKYKTAYYTFYLPVAMGMLLSGNVTQACCFEIAERICIKMGEYFQIQDDYLDCFGDPDVIGKIGTDIQECKCSWLVVQALKRVTASQRQILQDNYGVWNDEKVNKVKALYKELNLEQVFAEYEESSFAEIQKELDQLPSLLLPRNVFEVLLKKIYKRSK